MTATAKFLFDQDFGSGSAKPTISLADHQTKLAQVEQDAYRSGAAAAETRAAAEAQRSLAATLAASTAGFDRLLAALSALEARLEAEAVDVAVTVARKLVPELIAREPLAELTALANECFRHLVGIPHLAVRTSEALYEKTRETLTALARERGFEGRLVVLADPGIAAGDCRIEWADGGMVRDRRSTEAAIAEMITRYLDARQTGPQPAPASSAFAGRPKS
jgi:flagellar assembly protein FliH